MQDKNFIKLTDQDAALLEQGASMLEGLENDERNRGNCSTAEGAGCSAHAVRRLASALLAHEREIDQCLHQIQEPAAAEQSAWHAGLDEGRAQAAPAAVAVPDECAAFEAKFRHLDLSQKPDAWGHARYSHDAISLAWEAWQARAALATTPAAAAPVVLPEPDAVISELMGLVDEWGMESHLRGAAELDAQHSEATQEEIDCAKDRTSKERAAWKAIESKLRALLATATGLPAQAVAYIDSEVLTSFLSSRNYRPADGWDCHIRHQENKRDTDIPLYSRPQAQADARDADGEAFRTAARLGLTLRFYGNCAQSGAPGTPSVYEVTTGPDSAEEMRASIDRAAIAAAKEGAQQA